MKLYVKGARLTYANSLFTAQAKQQTDGSMSTPKFQGTFIVEAGTLGFAGDANPESATGKDKGYKYGPFNPALSKAIVTVAAMKFGPQAETILKQLKAQNRLVLHDGAEKGEKEGYGGNHYFNAGNPTRPLVLSKTGSAVAATDGMFYPGCYVDVVCDVWAGPNHKKAPMVGIALLGVMFNRDGERLSGGATASEDDFAPVAPEEQAKAAEGAGAASLFA